jgi:Tfp pilus assembly protein PilN
MKEKQKVITGYRSRYRKANRKEKAAILNEIQFIAGYNRKYAPRSPYQRLLESEALLTGVKAELARLCALSTPVQLQHTVNKAILALREAVAAQSPSSGREPAA